MDAKEKQNFWTTLPGVLTGIAAVLTAVVGLWTALSQSTDQNATPTTTQDTASVSLAVQSALLNPAERTALKTHQVTVRVTAPGELIPKIDHVTYLLPPSFGSESVTRSSAEDGFALKMAASGSYLLQAKVYFADGKVRDVSRQISLPSP